MYNFNMANMTREELTKVTSNHAAPLILDPSKSPLSFKSLTLREPLYLLFTSKQNPHTHTHTHTQTTRRREGDVDRILQRG